MTARPGRVVLRRTTPATPVAPPPAPAAPVPTRPPRTLVRAAPDAAARPVERAGPAWPPPEVLAAVAAAVVLATSAGDVFVAVVLLAVAGGRRVGVVAGLAAAATVARWGTTDLGSIAGDQAVLGLAVATGSGGARLGSALAAAALLLVVPTAAGRWRGATAIALGTGAATIAAGPAVGRADDLAVRVVATVAGALLAVLVVPRLQRHAGWSRLAPLAGVAVAGLALGLEVLA